MLDTTILLSVVGASSGLLSILVHGIIARRSQLEAQRPKINVELISDKENDEIKCHLIIQNVGSKSINVKSMRLYIFDDGFDEQFRLGLANYSTNIFIYKNRILNRVRNIDVECNYQNFIKVIMDILSYNQDAIQETVTEENFKELMSYNTGLEKLGPIDDGFEPALFIRPFFLFQKNIDFYTTLKKMPPDTFPQSVNVILFNYESYQSRWAKDPFALSDSTYRLNWEKNPAWIAPNLKSINDFKQRSSIHTIKPFAKRNDKAILSVSPTELGFPENFAPQEKRSINLEVRCKSTDDFKAKVNVWLTSNVAKYIILSKETTSNYHFTATPRDWSTVIKL